VESVADNSLAVELLTRLALAYIRQVYFWRFAIFPNRAELIRDSRYYRSCLNPPAPVEAKSRRVIGGAGRADSPAAA
jgi:hypothetical protein